MKNYWSDFIQIFLTYTRVLTVLFWTRNSGIKFSILKLQARYLKLWIKHLAIKVHISRGRTQFVFMFSPPKITWVISGIKYICLHLLPVFYIIQPSSKQIICFDFRKQNTYSILCTLLAIKSIMSLGWKFCFCYLFCSRLDKRHTLYLDSKVEESSYRPHKHRCPTSHSGSNIGQRYSDCN